MIMIMIMTMTWSAECARSIAFSSCGDFQTLPSGTVQKPEQKLLQNLEPRT